MSLFSYPLPKIFWFFFYLKWPMIKILSWWYHKSVPTLPQALKVQWASRGFVSRVDRCLLFFVFFLMQRSILLSNLEAWHVYEKASPFFLYPFSNVFDSFSALMQSIFYCPKRESVFLGPNFPFFLVVPFSKWVFFPFLRLCYFIFSIPVPNYLLLL